MLVIRYERLDLKLTNLAIIGSWFTERFGPFRESLSMNSRTIWENR